MGKSQQAERNELIKVSAVIQQVIMPSASFGLAPVIYFHL